MTDDVVSLDSLGLNFGTDKSSWHHNYLHFYESHLQSLRDKPLKLLEIGVAGGASLQMWAAYFRNATIIGADVDPEARRHAQDRISIEIVDQANEVELDALGARCGPFDIIVDDGSHQWDHQINSLRALFPFLKDEGIYIVEDLQTSFRAFSGAFGKPSTMTAVDYLKRLAEISTGGDYAEVKRDDDQFLLQYGLKVDSVTFRKHCCLIRKSGGPTAEPTIVPVPPEALDMLSFEAHIAIYGDRSSRSAAINGRGHDQNIQGFSIHCQDLPAGDFSFRARLQSGEWTDWAGSGAFVGTRGRSQDLTGFAVRLTGQSQIDYDIEVIGRFRQLAGHVTVGNDEDCVSPIPSDSLWGMQVIMWKNWAHYRSATP